MKFEKYSTHINVICIRTSYLIAYTIPYYYMTLTPILKIKKVKNLFLLMGNTYFIFCYNMNCDNTTSLMTQVVYSLIMPVKEGTISDESYDVFLLTITYKITVHLFLTILSMIFHYICYICVKVCIYSCTRNTCPLNHGTNLFAMVLSFFYENIYMKVRLPNDDPPIKTYPFKQSSPGKIMKLKGHPTIFIYIHLRLDNIQIGNELYITGIYTQQRNFEVSAVRN